MKSIFFIEKNKLFTEKREVLTERNEVLTERSEVLTERSEVLTERNEVLTERNEVLTERRRPEQTLPTPLPAERGRVADDPRSLACSCPVPRNQAAVTSEVTESFNSAPRLSSFFRFVSALHWLTFG
jgi:hypothetical protein